MTKPRRVLLGMAALLAAAKCPAALAAESYLSPLDREPAKVDLKGITPEGAEGESLLSFFKDRTQIGVGFDEEFNDNILLVDNAKRRDYISTLESLLLFADSRGALLYGLRYEVNAYRYHRLDRNAIDQDILAFADFDTGGRLLYHFDYALNVNNSLVSGTEGTDIIRRSTDFQKTVEHSWLAKAKYALNENNFLVAQTHYSLFDDQAVADASSDRKRFRGTLDLDHDLTSTWNVFGGYIYEDIFVPGDKSKNAERQGGRLGARYELTETQKLDATFELKHTTFKGGQTSLDPSFAGNFVYQPGPRTTLTLGYQDKQEVSFNAGRLHYRDRSPVVGILYDLTPLIRLHAEASHSKQTSSRSDSLTGSGLGSEKQTVYSLTAGFQWQVREQAHITADYSYSRSTTRDYTNNTVVVGFETQI